MNDGLIVVWSHGRITIRSPPAEQVLQPIDRLYASIARNPSAVAVGDTTYADLGAMVDALAAALQERDPAPGSRVGVCAPNTFEHLVALLATYAAGKVWVPLAPRNTRAVLDAMIAATRPTILLSDDIGVEDVK